MKTLICVAIIYSLFLVLNAATTIAHNQGLYISPTSENGSHLPLGNVLDGNSLNVTDGDTMTKEHTATQQVLLIVSVEDTEVVTPEIAGSGDYTSIFYDTSTIPEIQRVSGLFLDPETTTIYTTEQLNSSMTNTSCDQLQDPIEEIKTEAKEYMLYKIGLWIHLIWPPIIVPIGLVGNILSLIIMLQPQNRYISCCTYMAVLAVADNISLLRRGFEWVIYMGQKPYTDVECQIMAFIGLTAIQWGMFLIVLMTVDRLLAITFPLKASIYCKPGRAKLLSFVAFLTSFIFCIPHLMSTRPVGNHYFCATLTAEFQLMDYYAWANMIVNFFAPFIALTVMNGLIIKKIRLHSKKVEKHKQHQTPTRSYKAVELSSISFSDSPNLLRYEIKSENACNYGSEPDLNDIRVNGRRGVQQTKVFMHKQIPAVKRTKLRSTEAHLAVMLTMVAFSFVILNVPQAVRYILYLSIDRYSDPETYATFILVYHLSTKLYFTNNAINFFLYCIGGSKFRRSLKKLFACKNVSELRRRYKLEDNSISTNSNYMFDITSS